MLNKRSKLMIRYEMVIRDGDQVKDRYHLKCIE